MASVSTELSVIADWSTGAWQQAWRDWAHQEAKASVKENSSGEEGVGWEWTVVRGSSAVNETVGHNTHC